MYCVPLSSSTRRAGTDLGGREFLPTARRPGGTGQGAGGIATTYLQSGQAIIENRPRGAGFRRFSAKVATDLIFRLPLQAFGGGGG